MPPQCSQTKGAQRRSAVLHQGSCYFTIRVEGRDRLCQPPEGFHGHGRHAWQSAMLRQTTRPWYGGQANHRPPRWSSCYQASLVFQTHWFLHVQFVSLQETVQEPFFSHPGGGVGFACPGPAAPSSPPQTQYPQRQRTSPMRLDL